MKDQYESEEELNTDREFRDAVDELTDAGLTIAQFVGALIIARWLIKSAVKAGVKAALKA